MQSWCPGWKASLHILLGGQHPAAGMVQSLTRHHLLESLLGLQQSLFIHGIDDVDYTNVILVLAFDETKNKTSYYKNLNFYFSIFH